MPRALRTPVPVPARASLRSRAGARRALVLDVAVAVFLALPCAGAQESRWTSPRMPGVPFEELERKAGESLSAGDAEAAARYLAAGTALNPLWADGWWRLALLHFDAGRYPETRDTVRRLLPLEAPSGPTFALLGLAQYRLGELEAAQDSLSRAITLGVPVEQPIGRETAHQLALLLVRSGRFGQAVVYLERLATLEPDDGELLLACGLMALRMAKLPSEIDAADADLVLAAGRATLSALQYREEEARQRFGELVARFPKARGVHYAYGLYLSRHAAPEAQLLLQKEVELYADNAEAQLELAFAILERGEAKQALAPARAAVALAPGSAPAHLALGRALLAANVVEEATRELERSADLAPDVRDVHLALAQAYAKAGRSADVARARARLFELDKVRGAP